MQVRFVAHVRLTQLTCMIACCYRLRWSCLVATRLAARDSPVRAANCRAISVVAAAWRHPRHASDSHPLTLLSSSRLATTALALPGMPTSLVLCGGIQVVPAARLAGSPGSGSRFARPLERRRSPGAGHGLLRAAGCAAGSAAARGWRSAGGRPTAGVARFVWGGGFVASRSAAATEVRCASHVELSDIW